MKFCAYRINGEVSVGAYVGADQIVDLRSSGSIQGARNLDELIETISANPGQLARIETEVAKETNFISTNDVEWLPPVQKPGKIVGVAINNVIGQAFAHRPFENPAFFLKPRTSLVGHGAPVVVRDDYRLTHPEPELAVVIGKGGKHIPEDKALDSVFGYTIINDVTSPGLKERDSLEIVTPDVPGMDEGGYADLLEWRAVRDKDHARSVYLTYHALSKGSDTFGPIGPWIVTKDEIADPNKLAVNSFAGDKAVFTDSTANLTFSVQQVIAHLSNYQTLEPGDIIHMGTSMKPADGDGEFRTITDWDLTKIDAPMTIEIEGIGRLVNPVARETER